MIPCSPTMRKDCWLLNYWWLFVQEEKKIEDDVFFLSQGYWPSLSTPFLFALVAAKCFIDKIYKIQWALKYS